MSSRTDVLSEQASRELDEFLSLPGVEYIDAWKSLSPPAFSEMDGEFSPQFPPNFNDVHKRNVIDRLFDDNGPNGYWLGKAYTPLGQATGEGYNIWRMPGGRVERRIRFGTHMGVSLVDGRPTLVMTYASFNRDVSWQADTVDEIRKLADGVYIGCGTNRAQTLLRPEPGPNLEVYLSYGLELKEAYEFHERTPCVPALFVLTGPVAPYVGVDDATVEDH